MSAARRSRRSSGVRRRCVFPSDRAWGQRSIRACPSACAKRSRANGERAQEREPPLPPRPVVRLHPKGPLHREAAARIAAPPVAGRLRREQPAVDAGPQPPPAPRYLPLGETLLGESDRLVKAQPPLGIEREHPVDHDAVKVNRGLSAEPNRGRKETTPRRARGPTPGLDGRNVSSTPALT
jgi:hypothetical protein